MDNLNLPWLIPTLLQVVGLAIGLAVLGFGYQHAINESISFVAGLELGLLPWGLALGGSIFAIGTFFTQVGWDYKAVAICLAGLLIGLAWTNRQAGSEPAGE